MLKKQILNILKSILIIAIISAIILNFALIIMRTNTILNRKNAQTEQAVSNNIIVNVDINNPRIVEPVNVKQQKLHNMLQETWNKPKTQEILNKLSEKESVVVSFEADLRKIGLNRDWGNFKGTTSGGKIRLNENIDFTDAMLYKIFYHELFHSFHHLYGVTFEDYEDNKKYISDYAKTSLHEDLCETFTDYMLKTYHNINYYDRATNEYKANYVKEKMKIHIGIEI